MQTMLWLAPMALQGVGLLFAFFCPLSPQAYQHMLAALRQRRAGQSVSR